MRVLIVERDKFLFDSISTWLQKDSDHSLTRTLDYSDAAVEVKCQYFEVLIIGEKMPPTQANWMDELIFTSKNPQIHIIFVISNMNCICPIAIQKSANLSLIHSHDAKEFFTNMKVGCQKETLYISPYIVSKIGEVPMTTHPLRTLSRTEIRVASLLAQGMQNEQIANILFVSPLTVSDHRKKIKEKLVIRGGKNILLQYMEPYKLWLILQGKINKDAFLYNK
jgi:DNA-binding NarL/FixJ family response regulator